jgi:flagellar hook-basal body complex protein FliE
MNAAALIAAKAYGAVAATPVGPANSAVAIDPGAFQSMVTQSIAQAEAQGRAAEGVARGVVTGQAEMVNVVTQIAAAEVALDTVVAVRDQVISAYQEIMRMPI